MTRRALATPLTGPARPDVDWVVAPLFLLRVGGLPFDAVERLHFADTTRWAEEILDLEDLLDRGRQDVADLLERAVPRCQDAGDRRRLIRLRRDVFNLRGIADDSVLDIAAAVVGENKLGGLREWVAARRRLDRLHGQGEAILADELLTARRAVRELATVPEFSLGVQLSSTALDLHADTYLAATSDKLGKRARRIERSLLEDLFRTACKTSPFSTLTSVCLGFFRGGQDRLVRADVGAGGTRCVVRLNMAILERLSALILDNPETRVDLPVRVTSGWCEKNGRIHYLRRSRTPTTENASAKVESLRENLFFLPSGQLLTDLLSIAGGPARPRIGDLVERLADPAAGRRRDDVAQYVATLLRLGLLEVPGLKLDIHHPDPLERYRLGLAALDRPWATNLSDRLARIADAARDFASADLTARRGLLAALRESVIEAQRDLGCVAPPDSPTVLYEDAPLDAPHATADRSRWDEHILPDLRALARIMPVFDVNVVRRQVTRGFFHARHGEGAVCEDFTSFAYEFHQDFFDNFNKRLLRQGRFDENDDYVPRDNWFKQAGLTAVDTARERVAGHIREARRQLPPDAVELRLDRDFIDQVAAELPAGLGPLDPRSFFVQIADDGSSAPVTVLNRVYSGLTLMFSRFMHLFGEDAKLTALITDTLRDLHPDGAVFAEFKGGYDATNLNLQPAVTRYELVCPGDTSYRPPECQISMDDLEIVDDRHRGRLWLRSKRLGVEVIPVYLGFLIPAALPEIQQVLLNFSFTSTAQLDLWAGTGVRRPSDTVVRYPRIRYGNVVVQRQSWWMSADRLPSGRKDQPGHDLFLSWRRWRRHHDLPRRVFVTAENSAGRQRAADDSPEERGDAAQSRNGRGSHVEYKPLYIDFESYFSVSLLDGMARAAAGGLVFTEMLPDPDQLWLRTAGGRHVTELIVELDGLRAEQP